MGLRSFSMHPAQVSAVKQRILRSDTQKLRRMLDAATQSEQPALSWRQELQGAGIRPVGLPL